MNAQKRFTSMKNVRSLDYPYYALVLADNIKHNLHSVREPFYAVSFFFL